MQQIKSFLKSKGQKEKTIKTYCSVIGRIKSKLPQDFNESDVEICLERMNLNPSTYNLYRTIFNFYTTKYRGFSIKFTKSKVKRRLPTYVSREELRAVLDTIPNLKHKLKEAIINWWGKECPDYFEDCVVCQTWKQYKDLKSREGYISKDEVRKVLRTLCKHKNIDTKHCQSL